MQRSEIATDVRFKSERQDLCFPPKGFVTLLDEHPVIALLIPLQVLIRDKAELQPMG